MSPDGVFYDFGSDTSWRYGNGTFGTNTTNVFLDNAATREWWREVVRPSDPLGPLARARIALTRVRPSSPPDVIYKTRSVGLTWTLAGPFLLREERHRAALATHLPPVPGSVSWMRQRGRRPLRRRGSRR